MEIVVSPATMTLPKGSTQSYHAKGIYSNGVSRDLTAVAQWSVSSSGIASVSANGTARAVAEGTASVTATFQATSGRAQLTVSPASLQSIAVTPASTQINKGELHNYSATGTFSDGTLADLTTSASWTSSDPTVATIQSPGQVKAMTEGSATIQATVNGVAGRAQLGVGPALLVSLVLSPPALFYS